ncbi:conjugal transfer protein TraB [Streptomyces sp. NRRL_B-16638]|jgi:DNA repair ATPase RecN|uniref:Plasmid transfer protein n=2 Tax=Streptomyces coelicolor TaxID=1902 RepID=Q9AD49_STRCO|nr:conjugal transfer protein TraB [Streptomyces sp. NRRL_B-16638]AGO88563.1 plasmid transfer protein [Streptomyces coelicolor]MDX2929987.1 conjugal transfer protein TraB [Streptomyces sp. NRRL_B-16638]CAC36622.1 putative plasmid transfer protein [Streptomyces coelicolor A3(2)]
MSDLAPTTGGAAARTDGDNRYKAVQQKLKTLSTALQLAGDELEQLLRGMRQNAQRAEGLAVDIANAELDRKFIEMTNQVAVALGGAAVEVQKVHETAQEVSGLATDARRTHARLYEGLDTVRSGRSERTPKPGFFAR